jgi:outer membrane protein, heavy metal efflux system
MQRFTQRWFRDHPSAARQSRSSPSASDHGDWSSIAKSSLVAILLGAVGLEAAEPARGWRRFNPFTRVPTSQEMATQPARREPRAVPSVPAVETETIPPAAAEPASSVQMVSASQTDPPIPVPPTPEISASPDAAADGNAPAEIPAAMPTPEEALAAADVDGLTLDMLIGLADAHHPRLTTAYQRMQSARGRAWQAGLYPNPVVSVSSPQVDGNESQYNGFVQQEIVTAKKLKLDVAAVEREVSQAQCEWQRERMAILTNLRVQFYQTLAAQTRVTVLERLVKTAQRSKDVSERLLMAGEGTKGDKLLFEIEVERAEVDLANTRTIYELGRRQLAILAAVPDFEIAALAGDLNLVLRDYELTDLRMQVAAANPQANIARLEIDRRAYRLTRARVEPVPNIGVMAGAQRQVGIPSENQGLFQINVSVPLWNKNQGQIFAAEAELAGSRAELQRVELDLGQQAAEALASYQTAVQLVDRYDQQILPRARETQQISQNLYAQGQIDFLRLLQSQKTLLEAELARIDAQEQRWVSAALIANLLMEEVFP